MKIMYGIGTAFYLDWVIFGRDTALGCGTGSRGHRVIANCFYPFFFRAIQSYSSEQGRLSLIQTIQAPWHRLLPIYDAPPRAKLAGFLKSIETFGPLLVSAVWYGSVEASALVPGDHGAVNKGELPVGV